MINGRYTPYRDNVTDADALYSLVANHVANYATSIIEIEKVFMGDPAYYKYKDVKAKILRQSIKKGTEHDLQWAKDNNYIVPEEDIEKYNNGESVEGINASGIMPVTYTTNLSDGVSITKTILVSNLNEKDSDKTKRLGAGLSPGSEMRL